MTLPKVIYIGTYNVRSLAKKKQINKLQIELEKIRWDVIGLCEVRRKNMGFLDLENGHVLHYSGRSKGRTSGIGFIVHNRWTGKVKFTASSDRVGCLVIQLEGGKTLQLVQVYSPTARDSLGKIKDFYEEMFEMHQNVEGDVKIVMGDLNARLGSKNEVDSPYVGCYGYGQRDRRGNLLKDFIEKKKFYAVNTLFSDIPSNKWTWKSPKGDTSEIDYFFTTEDNIRWFDKCSVIPKFNTGSDHRLVRSKLYVGNWKRKPSKRPACNEKIMTRSNKKLYDNLRKIKRRTTSSKTQRERESPRLRNLNVENVCIV